MKKIICSILSVLLSISSYAQLMDSLYIEANNYGQKYSSKYFNQYSNIKAINDVHRFSCMIKTEKGNEFFIIDAETQNMYPAFDQQVLADSLAIPLKRGIDAFHLPFNSVQFAKDRSQIIFSVDKTKYTYNLSDYSLAKTEKEITKTYGYWGSTFKENSKARVKSPDGKKEAYIADGNLWVTDLENGKNKKLSYDGSALEYYSSNIYWSPDGEKIVCCKYRPAENRKLTMVISSPTDQLQPKTEEYDYAKPGDPLPIKQPVVFFVNEDRRITYNIPDIEQQYSLRSIRWDAGSSFFTFEFNKRGHQQYIIYAGNVQNEELRVVVKEEAPTFVYYNTLYRYWFEKSEELLWISERDGWRHLYLFNTANGKLKKQLTKGEWIVKSVEYVNEDNRTVIFKGCGMDKNEDPYLEKYYLLDINKGKITCLTPENANHKVTFTSDYKYMVDVFSRIDTVPTVVVRSLSDNKITFKPELQPDLSQALQVGYHYPEVFSAKGRDGKTDIWGIIMRPGNFDPSKKYPVIEYIYAGPHDSFVPKSFAISHWGCEMVDLGFIVVQIDGMGTANRSKAFHDVCWKNLKDAGFPDRIAWLKAAADKFPEMDIDKMGIYGCSAGGQSAMGALLFHPDFYKVGVAACGCHDNRMDKMWWNEQWMGYPIGKEYEECSNVENAHLLKGKLMLILGELDNNVDPSSTLQVVDKLIKHNKEFEFVMLPNERHTMGGTYGGRKRKDFFVKHLLQETPPEWNNK